MEDSLTKMKFIYCTFIMFSAPRKISRLVKDILHSFLMDRINLKTIGVLDCSYCSSQSRHWILDVAWRGVAWRGAVWCGVAWRGVVWCGVMWRGCVAWRGMTWCGVWRDVA